MPPNSVNWYAIELDVSAEQQSANVHLLSAAERRRAQQFVFAKHKHRWTTARAGLRRILASYVGETPQRISFAVSENGKPNLAPEIGACDVHFSLSHSKGLAVVAVTEIAPIGVDIEFEREISDWKAVAERYFSPAEREQLMTVDRSQRRRAFYCCWTRKEAIIKATGEGLSADLTSFDTLVYPNERPELLADRRRRAEADQWHLHHLEPCRGFIGALAIRSSHPVQVSGQIQC